MLPKTAAFLILAQALAHSVAAAPRTFTDTLGRSLQAEYIASDATSVTLNIAGKHHQLPLTRFSAADQAWISAQKKSPEAEGGMTPTPGAALPVMTQRQIAELLYRERARPQINLMVKDKFWRTGRVEELPAEDFHIHSIFEYTRNTTPFPWSLLQQMPRLIDFSINSTAAYTAAEITHLKALENPYSIGLKCSSPLDSAAVAALPRMDTVKVLFTSAQLLADAELPGFAKRFPNIERFAAGTEEDAPPLLFTGSGLASALPAWKNLINLNLGPIQVTAQAADALRKCPRLTELTLWNSPSIDWASLTNCENITALAFASHLGSLQQAPGLEDNLSLILAMPRLTNLTLAATRLQPQHLSKLKPSAKITRLDLFHDRTLDAATFSALCSALPALTEISLTGIPLAGSELAPLTQLKSLKKLRIRAMKNISEQDAKTLQQTLPSCQVDYRR